MGGRNTLKCRFSKCSCLHDSPDVERDEAVKEEKDGRNYYYHPDCYEIKTKVTKFKDYFLEKINPDLAKKQTATLLSILYVLIFEKGIEPDFIGYSLAYMAKYRPGKLKFPGGLYYVVQDKDILASWEKNKSAKLQRELSKEKELFKQSQIDNFEFNLPDDNNKIEYKVTGNRSRFSRITG